MASGQRSEEVDQAEQVDLRTDVAHPARVYNYLLGGTTHYEADRAAGDASVQAWPGLRTSMRQNRLFMHRATRRLSAEYGIRQFLDIGSGIPASPNLHEVAQKIAPDTRVVYVDNDPIVLAYAQESGNNSRGGTTSIEGDLLDPESILSHPALRDAFDFTKPIAVTLNAILQFLPDRLDPYGIVRRLMRDVAPGSALGISLGTGDTNPAQVASVVQEYEQRGMPLQLRSKSETERFFDGLSLIPPGVTLVHHWHPDGDVAADVHDTDVGSYGGVAIKDSVRPPQK